MDVSLQEAVMVGLAALASGAGVAGARKWGKKALRKRKSYSRAEAEAIVAHLEHVSHRHWDAERREKEIQHVMEKHRK